MSDDSNTSNETESQENRSRKISASASVRNLTRSRKITNKNIPAIAVEKTPLPEWADNWRKKLGEYDLGDTPASARMEELLGKDPNSAARQALYQSAKGKDVIGSDTNKETNSARLEFIEYIGKRFADLSQQKDFKDKPTTLEELIGKKGIELYQAACAEENNTKAFRDAVFISSSQTFDGPKWDQRLMIWVGGPSASGKSFGTEGLINQLNANGDPNSQDKNHVVSIDGGKEREMSQMRQMVLQLGLAEGFSGIKDLEKYSKDIKAKSYVQEAVLADGNLNMVTPATFTDPGGKHEKMMEEFAKDSNTKQIFAQVRGVPSTDELDGLDQFKQTVKKMGKRRAFRLELPDGVKNLPLADLVKPNNRKIGVESKDYDPEIFDFGVKQSNAMREKFEKICEKNGIPVNYFEITNDLIFIKKDSSNNWIKCSADDDFNTPGIRMTNVRAFEAYNKYKPMIPNLDVKDFMPQVYVQYKPDKKQWEEIKVEKDAKPPEGVISMSVAGWKIAQNLGAHEGPALDKFWKGVLADEVGAKSIVNKGGHPDRPDNQKDKNEENVNAVGAALRGMGMPLPERLKTPSVPNLLRGSLKVDKANLSDDGELRREKGTRKLATKRRSDSNNNVSSDNANTAVIVPNTQAVTTVENKAPVTLPTQPNNTEDELRAHFASLVKAGRVGDAPPIPVMPPVAPPKVQVSQGAERRAFVQIAQNRVQTPTQAGIAALSNTSVPSTPIVGLNNLARRTPPKALPKIPLPQNKANAIGQEALEATVSKAVLQSADMSRSKRSAIQFNQPGVVEGLQKEEEKLNTNKPLSGGHRNRAK